MGDSPALRVTEEQALAERQDLCTVRARGRTLLNLAQTSMPSRGNKSLPMIISVFRAEAAHTIKNVDQYENLMEELKNAVVPELELIQSRVMGPVKELQSIMKLIRKSITKREHKVRAFLYRVWRPANRSTMLVGGLRSLQ